MSGNFFLYHSFFSVKCVMWFIAEFCFLIYLYLCYILYIIALIYGTSKMDRSAMNCWGNTWCLESSHFVVSCDKVIYWHWQDQQGSWLQSVVCYQWIQIVSSPSALSSAGIRSKSTRSTPLSDTCSSIVVRLAGLISLLSLIIMSFFYSRF